MLLARLQATPAISKTRGKAQTTANWWAEALPQCSPLVMQAQYKGRTTVITLAELVQEVVHAVNWRMLASAHDTAGSLTAAEEYSLNPISKVPPHPLSMQAVP